MTTPQPPYNQHRSAGFSPWLVRIPVLFMLGMMLLALLMFVYLAALQLAYAERLYPGVFVGSTAVGGMTLDEARAALQADFTLDETTVFTFRYVEQAWAATAGELALSTISSAQSSSGRDCCCRAVITRLR